MQNSSCFNTDYVFDYGSNIPPEIINATKEVTLDLLPKKSKRLYLLTYSNYKSWSLSMKTMSQIEKVFLTYFTEISKMFFPPTLQNRLSMLKCTLKICDKINMSNFYQLIIAYIENKMLKYTKKHLKFLLLKLQPSFVMMPQIN